MSDRGDRTYKSVRTSNRECSYYVSRRLPFKASHIYSEWCGITRGGNETHWMYVVYSYGTHWPLYIYDDFIGVWYRNEGRYSSSTSIHSSKAHPGEETIDVGVDEMKRILRQGSTALVQQE